MKSRELNKTSLRDPLVLGLVMKSAAQLGEASVISEVRAAIESHRKRWTEMNAHSMLARTNFITARFNLELGVSTEQEYINCLSWLSSDTRTKIETMKQDRSRADMLAGILCEIDAAILFMCGPKCFCFPVWPDEDMGMGTRAVDLEVYEAEKDVMKIQVKGGKRCVGGYAVPTLKNTAQAIKFIVTGEYSPSNHPISEVVTSYELAEVVKPIFDAQSRARVCGTLTPEDQSLLALGGVMSSSLLSRVRSVPLVS